MTASRGDHGISGTFRTVASEGRRNTLGKNTGLDLLLSAVIRTLWTRQSRIGEAGDTFTELARSVGRSVSTVRDYVARHGFRCPVGPPAWSPTPMSLVDREEISRGLVRRPGGLRSARMLRSAAFPTLLHAPHCG